jgi:uncharacterized Fe-S cluster protein YjdI
MADVRKDYERDGIVVTWDSQYCIHSANCVRGLPQVFDTNRRPWITPDAAAADEIASVIERCPSGALSYRRTDGALQEQAPDEPFVYPIPNGPLYVNAALTIRDEDGNVQREATRMTLCRCGASENKPFCDSSHLRIGFRTT